MEEGSSRLKFWFDKYNEFFGGCMTALALFLLFFPSLGGPPGPRGPSGPSKNGKHERNKANAIIQPPKTNLYLVKQNFCLVLAGPHLLHILIDNDKRNMAISDNAPLQMIMLVVQDAI